MTTSRSGSHPIDADALRAQLGSLERPTIAKTRGSLREALKSKSRSEFSAAFLACGLSIGDLARELGVAKSYIHDMLHGRRDVPDWILRGMPRDGRLVVARGYIEDVQRELPSSVGWR
jgi:hypothetical protein